MTNLNASFGMSCPQCGTVFGTRVGGQPGVCCRCGGVLVAAKGAIEPEALLNFHCRHCNTVVGHLQSMSPITVCPSCKMPID